jgi:hypothetical protein
MIKPISFNKLSCNPVYYSLYCESFFPIVSVSPRQNIQMMTVLHTSAKDLDTGLMSLEIVTAMGTDMPIENTNIIMNVNNVVFLVIWS